LLHSKIDHLFQSLIHKKTDISPGSDISILAIYRSFSLIYFLDGDGCFLPNCCFAAARNTEFKAVCPAEEGED
jgi:hypothetical protein